MEYSHFEIETYVRQAQQERAEAIGDMLSHGWRSLKEMLSRLVHHHGHSHGDLAHS